MKIKRFKSDSLSFIDLEEFYFDDLLFPFFPFSCLLVLFCWSFIL